MIDVLVSSLSSIVTNSLLGFERSLINNLLPEVALLALMIRYLLSSVVPAPI